MLNLAVIIVVVAFVVGCSDTSSSGPSDTELRKSNAHLIWLHDVDHTFLAYKARTAVVVYDTVNDEYIKADFSDNDYVTAFVSDAPDSVHFNSRRMDALDTPHKNFNLHGSHWSYNGGTYSFRTFGSNSYSVSVQAPTKEITLSYPRNGDEVNKATGLVLKWEPANDGSEVSVVVAPSMSSGNNIVAETNDAGTCTITADEMKTLSPGIYSVTIKRGKYSVGISEGKRYGAAIYTQQTVGVIVH